MRRLKQVKLVKQMKYPSSPPLWWVVLAAIFALVACLTDVDGQGPRPAAHRTGRVIVKYAGAPPALIEGDEATAWAIRFVPGVEYAEEDMAVPPDYVPNDPQFSSQWHHATVGAPAAWDAPNGHGEGVIIAILDTGCDPTHPDLAPSYVPGWNFYDNNSNTADVYGHGTATAGTAAAAGDNGLGVAGSAYASRIMPCRISGTDGYATYSAAASALRWAADRGARVANISYEMTDSLSVQDSAQYFQSKGGMVTISAGNRNVALSSANPPQIFTVAASTAGDARSSYSNYNSSTGGPVDIYAPGDGIYTTSRGGGCGWWSGTSFSAPDSAGAAACLLSARPDLTGAQARDILAATAKPIAAGGRLDMGAAMASALGAAPPPPPPPPVEDTEAPACAITSPADGSRVPTGKGNTNLGVSVSASDNIGVVRVELFIDGQLQSTDTASPWSFNAQTKKWSLGAHAVTARAYDAAGNIGIAGITVYK